MTDIEKLRDKVNPSNNVAANFSFTSLLRKSDQVWSFFLHWR